MKKYIFKFDCWHFIFTENKNKCSVYFYTFNYLMFKKELPLHLYLYIKNKISNDKICILNKINIFEALCRLYGGAQNG